MIKDKVVLVTGAGGFIGSHLVEMLVGQGAKVRAFVRYNSRQDWGCLSFLRPDIMAQVEVVSGDLQDAQAVEAAVDGTSVVFHLGALISIPYSYNHPREVAAVNITGTLNVLDAVRKFQTARLVHTSTSEVYGTAQYVPIDEKHPLQGQSPYSASKIGADKLVESYWRAFGVPAVTIRPFNTYGPRQSTRAIIPTIITQALHGDRIMLGSLDPKRDLTFVSDTVVGFIKAATAPASVVGKTINLGSGREISIAELADAIIKVVGRDVRIVADPKRLRPEKSEVERLLADNSLAAEVLDWRPEVSLENGILMTVEWIRLHLAAFRNINHYSI